MPGTNYRITVLEQGWSAATQWKVRHDWLERELGRERQKNFHLAAIGEIDRKQIKSMKWDALGGKILVGVIVVAAVFGGTYAIIQNNK